MASQGRRKSYFEFMRESIILGIKEYRPMKSKYHNAVPLAYLVVVDEKDEPKWTLLLVAWKVSRDVIMGMLRKASRCCKEARYAWNSVITAGDCRLRGSNPEYPGCPAGREQHLFCVFHCTWLKGKEAGRFWLWLGGSDKHMSVCRSVFPWAIRTSLKHKLGTLMSIYHWQWPSLQNDIVNQAKYRGTPGVRWSLCVCRGMVNSEPSFERTKEQVNTNPTITQQIHCDDL